MNTNCLVRSLALLSLLLSLGSGARAQPCSDLNEPNNNYQQATPVSPGTSDHGLINPSGDVDVFSFPITNEEANARIIVSDLPANFDIKLYNSSGQQVGASKNRGKRNDTIIKNNTAEGIYYARVFGNQGKFDEDECFVITVETSSSPFRLIHPATEDASAADIAVYPNPVVSQLSIMVQSNGFDNGTIRVYDLTGKLLMSEPIRGKQGSEYVFDISTLPAGEYFLQLRSSEAMAVKKFFVQR